jgi:hypothetical protein
MFQFEESGPPHSWLIIRSPKRPGYPSQVDLMFLGLKYISSRAWFNGMKLERLEEGTPEDTELLERSHFERYKGSPVVFRVESLVEDELVTGYVVAGNLFLYEEELDDGAEPSWTIRRDTRVD